MTTETHNTDGTDEALVDRAYLACIRGHDEAKDRLRELGWSDEMIEDLEDNVRGPVHFARCVADEVRWHRD